MKPDPGIDEIRLVRHRISEECGHNPAELVRYYIRMQQRFRDRLLARRSDVEATESPDAGQPARSADVASPRR